MILRLHTKRTIFVLGFFFLLLQQAFLNYTSGTIHKLISYSDEALACVLLVCMGLRALWGRIVMAKLELGMMVCYLVFLLFGLASSLFHSLQSGFLTLADMLVCSRFLLFYYATRFLLPKSINYKKLMGALAKGCRVLAVVLLALAVHDMLWEPLFPKREYRYFMDSLQLCFPHPTYMAVACMSCASTLAGAMGCGKIAGNAKKNLACICIFLLLTVLTLRSKAIAAVLCAMAFYVLLVKWGITSRTLIFTGGALITGIVGFDQLAYYYIRGRGNFVRARLFADSLDLAGKYFPLGTGFATFGSALAAGHYSPLYSALGYDLLSGGSRENTRYLCDTFWPTVIAQTGWIGAIAFVGIVVCLLQIPFRFRRKNRYFLWGMLMILTYELIASVAEPAFFNPPAAVLMTVFALMVNIQEEEGRTEENICLKN